MKLTRLQAHRPMHGLLQFLWQRAFPLEEEFDISIIPTEILRQAISDADDCAGALQLGVSAIGYLIAYSAPQIEDGTISSDTIEALGWLFSELGELGGFSMEVASYCRRAQGDKVNAKDSQPI
jgi:hypothetical protein